MFDERNSKELAADKNYASVWDPEVPFPMPDEMEDVDVVTHVCVTKAKKGGYHYLHEATIQWHKDRFYMAFANHPTRETGDYDELIRGCTSADGIHWTEPEIWVQNQPEGMNSNNHPLMFSHNGVLYGFFVCWDKDHNPHTEIFILNEETGKWEHQEGCGIPMFLPFSNPQKMENGNWIMSGENVWLYSAVVISRGDDLTKWDFVKIPRDEDVHIYFPESAVVDMGGGHLVDICRPYNGTHPHCLIEKPCRMPTAPVAESFDFGRTWTKLRMSNFPLADSQPFAGKLSNGQRFLITNSLEDKRTLISIAVTDKNGGLFKKIFKVRHCPWPKVRLFENSLGKETEWSYPNAFEHEGKLYIAYTQGKEDCTLSIIPLECLDIEE